MKNVRIIGIAIFASLPLASAHAGRCGPFDIFEGNDYCVACQPGGGSKVYACPGGDVGMTSVGIANPGCTVSYWSPSCGPGAPALSKEVKAKENEKHNAVKLGHPSLTKQADEVIIRMKQADFDKLMQGK